MHLESEYLEGNTTIKPEEQFGYKEVQYTETGNILLDDNGNTIYKLSSETGQYDTGHGVTYDGAYRKYNGDQFPCDYFEADGKPAGDKNVKNAYGDGTAYTETQNITTADSSGNKRTWGIYKSLVYTLAFTSSKQLSYLLAIIDIDSFLYLFKLLTTLEPKNVSPSLSVGSYIITSAPLALIRFITP